MELSLPDSGRPCDRVVREVVSHSDHDIESNRRHGFKRLFVLILSLAVLVAGLYLFNSSTVAHPSVSPKTIRGPKYTDLNLPLLSQQLDELFRLFLKRIPEETTLRAEDRMWLQTWLQFDERFVEQNQDRESLKYERVTAYLRLGQGLFLLQKPIASATYFQSAVELLQSLVDENPALVSYRLELADAYQGLGYSLDAAGRGNESLGAMDAAIRTLRDPALPADSGQEERLIDLYQSRTQMLTPDGSAQ